MKHVFAEPFEFEGKTYEEIDIALESLKCSDMSAVKKQFAAQGEFSPMPAADSDYCMLIAARAAKMPIEFFNEMPAPEYYAISQAVGSFLISSVLKSKTQ